MMTIVEKLKLVESILSGGDVSRYYLKNLKESYETSRDKVLGEDMFYADSFVEVYGCMRDADSAYSDYIKALESRVTYLEGVAVDFASGVAQDNSEFVRDLVKSNDERQSRIEAIKDTLNNMNDLLSEFTFLD